MLHEFNTDIVNDLMPLYWLTQNPSLWNLSIASVTVLNCSRASTALWADILSSGYVCLHCVLEDFHVELTPFRSVHPLCWINPVIRYSWEFWYRMILPQFITSWPDQNIDGNSNSAGVKSENLAGLGISIENGSDRAKTW